MHICLCYCCLFNAGSSGHCCLLSAAFTQGSDATVVLCVQIDLQASTLAGTASHKATVPPSRATMPRILEDAPVDADAAPPAALFPHASPNLIANTRSSSGVPGSLSAHTASARKSVAMPRDSIGGGVLSPPVLDQVAEESDVPSSDADTTPGDPPLTPAAGLVADADVSPDHEASSAMDTGCSTATEGSGHRSISFSSPARGLPCHVATPPAFRGFGSVQGVAPDRYDQLP